MLRAMLNSSRPLPASNGVALGSGGCSTGLVVALTALDADAMPLSLAGEVRLEGLEDFAEVAAGLLLAGLVFVSGGETAGRSDAVEGCGAGWASTGEFEST